MNPTVEEDPVDLENTTLPTVEKESVDLEVATYNFYLSLHVMYPVVFFEEYWVVYLPVKKLLFLSQ